MPPLSDETCTCGKGRTCRGHARAHAAAAVEAAWANDVARLRALRRARRAATPAAVLEQ